LKPYYSNLLKEKEPCLNARNPDRASCKLVKSPTGNGE
jgi:hypothetical protein